MKVLLIQPPNTLTDIAARTVCLEPLALEYIAAGIIDEHDVKILDMRLDDNLDQLLKEFNPDVVGITSYTVNVNTVKSLFKKIKNFNLCIVTVVGGHHATVVPEDFLIPDIDIVVIGEGIFTFKEIVSRIQKNKGFEGISGIAYMKNLEQVIINPKPVTDLDVLPIPARELTEKYRQHYFLGWKKPVGTIRTSTGCPYRCKFCAIWKAAGGKYLERKPENIVKELSKIREDYIFFADDESFINADRMKILAESIRNAGIKKRYFMYGRADTIVRNPEIIEIWREIGLEDILIGFEFFRDDDLKDFNKKMTIDTHKRAVEILHANGVYISANFIVKPDFREEDFIELRNYCRDLKLLDSHFTVLTPFPGTELYEEVKDTLISKNYDLYDIYHPVVPTYLPLNEFFDKFATLSETIMTPEEANSMLLKIPIEQRENFIVAAMEYFKDIRNAYKNYSTDRLCQQP